MALPIKIEHLQCPSCFPMYSCNRSWDLTVWLTCNCKPSIMIGDAKIYFGAFFCSVVRCRMTKNSWTDREMPHLRHHENAVEIHVINTITYKFGHVTPCYLAYMYLYLFIPSHIATMCHHLLEAICPRYDITDPPCSSKPPIIYSSSSDLCMIPAITRTPSHV